MPWLGVFKYINHGCTPLVWLEVFKCFKQSLHCKYVCTGHDRQTDTGWDTFAFFELLLSICKNLPIRTVNSLSTLITSSIS